MHATTIPADFIAISAQAKTEEEMRRMFCGEIPKPGDRLVPICRDVKVLPDGTHIANFDWVLRSSD
jgi:hypothetical protein